MTQAAAMQAHGQEAGPSGLQPFGVAPSLGVLVVEDEAGLADVLALHFGAAGHRTRVATDGLHALFEIERERPDLVVLDLSLPVLSGFRLVQLLKQDEATRDVPVLVLTALSFGEAKEAVQAGADDFLMKPVLPQAIVERAQALLRRVNLASGWPAAQAALPAA